MRRLDELHLDYPFAGSRTLRDFLVREGVSIAGCHAASRLKRIGIGAIYRRLEHRANPRLATEIYPYLVARGED